MKPRTASISVVLLLALAPTAAASRAEELEGSCSFQGSVRFDPPLRPRGAPTEARARAEGACTGTWTTRSGRPIALKGAPVRYSAASEGSQSCQTSDAHGRGSFRFRHRRLRFRLAEERLLTGAPLELHGRHGGEFLGQANATSPPAEVIAACIANGVAEATIDIEGSTTGIRG